MRPVIDLSGQQFGRLTVLERAPPEGRNAKRGEACWRVRCECGRERTIRGSHLRSGATRSCGCLRAPLGFFGTPEYQALHNARQRCTNANVPNFADYGARGIEYRLPAALGEATALLIAAIGPRPEGKTLDRIDNEGHYEVGNLRWATWSEQSRNRRKRAQP